MVKLIALKYIHANAFCRMFNNKNVRKYLSDRIPNPYKHADAFRYIYDSKRNDSHLAMVIKYKLFIVGSVAATIDNNQADISYLLNYRFWNKGIAKIAVGDFLDILKEKSIKRCNAEVYKGNYASRGVLEHNKFIFQYETETSWFFTKKLN